MHVQVADESSRSAGDLIRFLLEAFDAAGVPFDSERGKARSESDGDADRALVTAPGVIEKWVTTCERQSGTVEVDGCACTLYPSASLGGVR
jgi:hypothetical protein